MQVARILSRAQLGLTAPQVQVEVHLGRGLPAFTIVGLPAPVVRESRERVRAALLSSGFQFPQRRITVNLAPVELAKHGGRFDLPIALGLLVASGQLAPRESPAIECYGELGLGGELRGVSGLLPAAVQAGRDGHAMLVPEANALEVGLAAPSAAYAVGSLREAVQLLRAGRHRGAPIAVAPIAATAPSAMTAAPDSLPRLCEVVGQYHAKRALQVAAAGAHGVLLIGPPGSGKSMLAARLPGLLPGLTSAEALEVAGIRAVAGLSSEPGRFLERPLRSPHHTSSVQALVGGGPQLWPGEISLAHQGVLFLDELPEFDRRALEALREPLDSGCIALARAGRRLQLPARFQLVAAMNPCPCGYLGDARIDCRCSAAQRARYRQRLSGPLLDRIDIRVRVRRLSAAELLQAAAPAAGETRCGPAGAAQLEEDMGRTAQAARCRRTALSGAPSARLSAAELQACCPLSAEALSLLRRSCQRWSISGRGVQRLLALSRTIADLAGSEPIEAAHLAEALQLRRPLELE